MKERPILFSAPMVRAILDGTKVQTRRAVKFNIAGRVGPLSKQWHIEHPGVTAACPYGQPSDRLWVRETFSLEHCVEHDQDPPHKDGRPIRLARDPDEPRWIQPHYRATDPAPLLSCERDNCAQCRDHDMGPHWRPAIHMPRWACRLVLDITSVSVQRLHDITRDDVRDEGVRIPTDVDTGNVLLEIGSKNSPASFLQQGHTADDLVRAHFASLWAGINGRDSWDANPWVWAITFRRVQP